jgi:hypothetical protein
MLGPVASLDIIEKLYPRITGSLESWVCGKEALSSDETPAGSFEPRSHA